MVSGITKSRFTPLLFIIILHIIWFVAALVWKNFYNGDSYEYVYLAENIKEGYYYSGDPALPLAEYRLTLRTPVYALFILLSYTLFGYNTIMILIAQNVLSIISCWLIYDIFQKTSPAVKHKWIYLLLIAVYPAQFFFSDMLVPDILMQFFLVLYFRQLLLSLTKRTPPRTLIIGIWLILAALTKPIIYPFLALHFLFSLFYAIRSRRMVILLTGALPLFLMIGYGLWNQQRTGFFHISSIQSINLLDYNVNTFIASKKGKPFADSLTNIEKEKIKNLPDLKAKYQYASEQSKKVIKENFIAYSLFHIRESFRFFLEPGKSELDLFTGYLGYDFKDKSTNFYDSYRKNGLSGAWQYLSRYPPLPFLLLVVLFNLLRFLGWLLFLRDKRIPIMIRVVASIYIVYFAVITGPVANTRYFLPVLLMMSGCAMIGYSGLIEQIKNRKQHT